MLRQIVGHLKILLGIASGPGLMLLLPLLLSSRAYGEVFGFIAVVQLLTLFSSVGLEIVASRESLPVSATLQILLPTTLLATLVYGVFTSTPHTHEWLALAGGTAVATNLALVVQNRFLFQGDAAGYAIFGIARAALLIGVLLASIRGGVDVTTAWALASIASLALPLLSLRAYRSLTNAPRAAAAPARMGLRATLAMLAVSLPMAVLNSLASLPFIAERLMARASFSAELFPRYALCSTLLMPLIYLGNTSQNYLITHNERIGRSAALGSARLLVGVSVVYMAVLLTAVQLRLPPYFENVGEFYDIALPCGFWVLCYCICAFPLAAITQKHAEGAMLRRCAAASAGAVLALFACYVAARHLGLRLDRPWKLALASLTLAGTIVAIRGVFVWPLTRVRDAR